jgi:TetR/AcrR family transcriptional regulator
MHHHTPKKRVKRNRKEDILRSARELFFTKGFRLTTIEQIAVHAGYSKRSVYLDYANKDDLFITICNEGLGTVLEQIRGIPRDALPFEEYVDRYLGTIMSFSYEHPEYFKMLTADVTPEIIAGCSEAVRNGAYELERAGIELMAETVQKAIDGKVIREGNAWEIAEIFIGSVVGIVTLTLGGSQAMMSPAEMQSKVRTLGRLLYRGLRADCS